MYKVITLKSFTINNKTYNEGDVISKPFDNLQKAISFMNFFGTILQKCFKLKYDEISLKVEKM